MNEGWSVDNGERNGSQMEFQIECIFYEYNFFI